jgi:hypothetical protein
MVPAIVFHQRQKIAIPLYPGKACNQYLSVYGIQTKLHGRLSKSEEGQKYSEQNKAKKHHLVFESDQKLSSRIPVCSVWHHIKIPSTTTSDPLS